MFRASDRPSCAYAFTVHTAAPEAKATMMGHDPRMGPAQQNSSTTDSRPVHTPVGWLSVALNFAFSAYGYYGFAPPPDGMPTDWWHGRTYILDYETMGGFVDDPVSGALLFGIPAVLLFITTVLTTRSAIARTLSLGFGLTAVLFALGGFAGAGPWVLFSWRFTVVMTSIGCAVAAACMAPLLVERWLRFSSPARIAIYFPIFFGLMAAVRGATGTSEHMAFMVSPWPIFTTYGLVTLALLVSVVLFAVATGLVSLASGKMNGAAGAGMLTAFAIPIGWIAYAGTELPIETGLIPALVAMALIGISVSRPGAGSREDNLLQRGYKVGLGAALTFVPIFAGQALATGDYASNRNVRAPQVIEALQNHIKVEEFYPETLNGLVETGYLDEMPKPRVGFQFLELIGLADEVKYRYNEYGSSFILEFDASLWTQCSYSGNYYFDEEEEEEFEEEEEPEWSCLNKSPALFGGGDAEGEDEDEYDYEDEE